jgi:hypothetical protein
MATDDEAVQETVLRTVLHDMSSIDLGETSPAVARRIQRLVRKHSGNPDPYRTVKQRSNRLALKLLPDLRERVRQAADPLEMAVRMAIAGNVIDYGVHSAVEDSTLRDTIDRAAAAQLEGDVARFARELAAARSILYLADNAGEIVMDRLLIEQLGAERVTVAVKGEPVLNDALRADAEAAGLDAVVDIIDNGSDAPGTILESCSDGFRRRFETTDLVIAKGQGNYETLSDAARPVWFVLMVKCSVIANHMGCDPGAMVVLRRPEDGADRAVS